MNNLTTQELLQLKQEALARKLINYAKDSVILKAIQGYYHGTI